MTPANLPSVPAQWAKRPVFHWYDHLTTIFAPSVGWENVISHIEDLTKLTQWALNDSNQAIHLLNSEISMMRKAILQNRIVLDILITSQGYTYAIIQTEGCVYIPGGSCNG